jgi:hypothetical protein
MQTEAEGTVTELGQYLSKVTPLAQDTCTFGTMFVIK